MNDNEIWNWLESELDDAHINLQDAESRMTEIENAMEQYSDKKSLPRDMREEYNEWKKDCEEDE